MDILRDIKNIVKNDDEHHLKIEVSWDGVNVYLDYDPAKEFKEDCIIPIHYCTIEEFAYIPDDEFKDKFRPGCYGITIDEIVLIKNIMEYLESHKEEIAELCCGYSWEDRKDKKEKEDENNEEILAV